MTTSDLMSLPVDIPWKRLAISKDMMDPRFGDRKYPAKWRSSSAVFYYEPPEEQQRFDDRIITYLKVTCSITGFQEWEENKGEARFPFDIPFMQNAPFAIKWFSDYYNSIYSYYACHGALVQVSVFPGPDAKDIPLEEYPIILDFEPKKREMYESGTEKKEILSGSRSSIGIQKGTTTTSGSEFQLNFGDSFNLGGDNFSLGLSSGMNMSSSSSVQHINMLNTDYSREKRENFSYITNVTHMYHLLNSYHIGTNRALFLLLPRPHIAGTDELEFLFVNGPRKLEGIQEFILIVERPKKLSRLCVEVTLETAHMKTSRKMIPKIVPENDENIRKTALALKIPGLKEDLRSQQLERLVQFWNDTDSDIRKVMSENVALPSQTYEGWKAAFEYGKKVAGEFGGSAGGDFPYTKEQYENIKSLLSKADRPIEWHQKAIVIYERSEQTEATLFVTGRQVSGCYQGTKVVQMADIPDSYIYEGGATEDMVSGIRLPDDVSVNSNSIPDVSHKIASIKQLVRNIGEKMIEKTNSSERFAYGELSFKEASFIQQPILKELQKMSDDDPYNLPLDSIEELDPDVRDQLINSFEVETRKKALAIEPYQLRAVLGMSEAQVRKLRSQLIGLGPQLQIQEGTVPVVVPNVVGLTREEAEALLVEKRLYLQYELTYQDSTEPQNTVLNQFPNAGDLAKYGDQVNLVVSTGPVTIPNVVGQEVHGAGEQIEELSLHVLPSFIPSNTYPQGYVIETTPAANAGVARNTQVVMLVSSGSIE